MRYVLDAKTAKEVDRYTIEEIGIPSLVLMERAALAVAKKTAEIAADFGRLVRICAVCGCGNNGADAVAAARILTSQGMNVDIIVVGNDERATKDFSKQIEIAANSSMSFRNVATIPEYDIVIDGIFGIGLGRAVEGEYAEIINLINTSKNIVVSVDVPSGVCASTGNILGTAIKADATVTFGYNKIGLMLYPGKELAGEITVADIGFSVGALKNIPTAMYFTKEDVLGIPERDAYSNKGTYGRCLCIAGNKEMSGAAYLCGASAYRTGVGLVEIFTSEKNETVIRNLLPEAIVTGYNDNNYLELLDNKIHRADTIILGPGLGRDSISTEIVEFVLEKVDTTLIIDADALNIISCNRDLLKKSRANIIITPHIGEMARLTGLSRKEIADDPIKIAKQFANEYNIICVIKDAATVAVQPEPKNRVYINSSGCGAMSKGGMGDVLTGVIAGMLALKLEPFSATAMGIYVHGLAGELAAMDNNEHTIVASDLLQEFGKVLGRRK